MQSDQVTTYVLASTPVPEPGLAAAFFRSGPAPRCSTLALLTLVLLCGGCNWFKPLAFVLPPPTQKIPAEFAHLAGSVTIVVWVRNETLYDYPYARLEVAGHVADHLTASIKPPITCADLPRVEAWLDQHGGRVVDPEKIGREFGTRFVLYLELLEFTMRDPHLPDLLQGRIRASVVVYDLSRTDAPATTYDLAPVETIVPPKPTSYTQNNALIVRKALYETFAGQVAKKFYEHEEEVK